MRAVNRIVGAGLASLSLLAFAASASAQEVVEQLRLRQGFWAGLGLGHGSLGCEGCDSREGALSGNLRLGGTLSQKLLLGFESNTWYKSEDGGSLEMSNGSAIAVFYPSETGGFHLKGGLGVSRLRAAIEGLGSDSEWGVGAVLGVGYDFRVARNISLTPYLNGVGGNFDGGTANFWQIGLGFSWH